MSIVRWAAAAAVIVMLVSGFVSKAQAGGTTIDQTAKFKLTPDALGASGEAELRLQVKDGVGGVAVRVKAQGLTDGQHYSLWVNDTFLDDAMADAGKVELEEDMATDATSLSGSHVEIRKGINNGLGTLALHGSVP